MSKYTAEQVERAAKRMEFEGYGGDMLRDYADLLRERESAKETEGWQIIMQEKPAGATHYMIQPKWKHGRLRVDVRWLKSWENGGYAEWCTDCDDEYPAYRPLGIPSLSPIPIDVAPMLASETSDELKEWEEFGRQIEKRLRYNPWGFKGSYPEIIDQVMTMASARVPDEWVRRLSAPITSEELKRAWNMIGQAHPQKEWVERALIGFIELRLAAAPKLETEE